MKGLLYKDISIMTRSFKGNILLLVALYGVLILVTREAYLAYAMTVHKSQGSEYQAVVLAAWSCAPNLRTRSVLYTAITRARKLLVVVGREDILQAMTENHRRSRRYSGLKLRLQQEDRE